MKTFIIDSDDNISVFASVEEAARYRGWSDLIPSISFEAWRNSGLPIGWSRSGTA